MKQASWDFGRVWQCHPTPKGRKEISEVETEETNTQQPKGRKALPSSPRAAASSRARVDLVWRCPQASRAHRAVSAPCAHLLPRPQLPSPPFSNQRRVLYTLCVRGGTHMRATMNSFHLGLPFYQTWGLHDRKHVLIICVLRAWAGVDP